MSDVRLVADGSGEDSFIITREQVSKIIDAAYEQGRKNSLKPGWFECKHDELWLSVRFGQVARAELVHKRTAEHLRRERKRRRIAECANSGLHRQLRAWYGGETVTSLFDTPAHYRGDGHVTCRRAMESCESQEKVVEPSRMAFYWWACAFKYVWRCWSKADPETDMRKAIECLKKAMGELSGCVRQVAHERVEWCGVTREESNG